MKVGLAVASLLLIAGSSYAADPVYLDELVEMPLANLQRQFSGLKTEGCYQIGTGQYLVISIDKKDQKPWRAVLANEAPCRNPANVPLEVRTRSGVSLGDNSVGIVEHLGRPDASMAPETTNRKLGDMEYFFICRVSEGCARHTSVFMKNGVVSAIAEWYSE